MAKNTSTPAKTNTLASKQAQTIMQTLVVSQGKIQSADISTWTNAVNSAKAGTRTLLYNLYDNLMSDGVLADAIDKYHNKVTNAEIAFSVNGKNIPEIDALIDTPEFEDLIKEIANAKIYGRSVVEVGFLPDFSIFAFPRKNCIIRDMDKPLAQRKKYIVAKESDTTGYDYSQDDFFLEFGKDDDLGKIFRAAQYVIYKRGNFGDWAQYAELFGMPFLLGKYNSTDIAARDQLFEALGMIGGKPIAAVPKEADVEAVQYTSAGSSALYKMLHDACNTEILIAIQGETMTTLSGSSRSQAEVHQDTDDASTKALRRYVQRMLNKYLVPLLIKRGYPAAGGKFSFVTESERMSTKDKVDLGMTLRDKGIAVADDYFYETTGIPKPTAAQVRKQEKAAEATQTVSKDGEDNNPPEDTATQKKADPPKKAVKLSDTDRNLFERVLDFFAVAPTKERGDQRNSGTKLTGNTSDKLRLADKYTIDIDGLLQQALNEVYQNEKKGTKQPLVSKPLFDITNNALQQGIVSVFSEPEFGKKNEAFINEFRHNTAVFSAFKNHQQTKEIVGLLTDEDGKLRSFRDFKKLALQVSKDYNVKWLQTEYNTAIRSARSAVNYRKYLETKHLYPNLEYMESTASVQREKHLEYVGTILPIEHPWWYKHMPPSDWNCACSVRPTNKPVTPVPGEPAEPNPVFHNNPGKTAEPVNLKEHPYIKGVCKSFNGCNYRQTGGSALTLSDSLAPNRPECAICIIAIAYSKKLSKELEVVRKWYKKELPAINVGKFKAKRFEVDHHDINRPIIINRNFYEEVMSKHKNDPKYFYRLELIKDAHNLIKEAKFITNEIPKHHPDASRFLVFHYEKNGLKLEFKCKDNPDGIFLYYMRIIE